MYIKAKVDSKLIITETEDPFLYIIFNVTDSNVSYMVIYESQKDSFEKNLRNSMPS